MDYPVRGRGRPALGALALIVSLSCVNAVPAQAYDVYGLQNGATGDCMVGDYTPRPPREGGSYTTCSYISDGVWVVSGMGNGGVRLQNRFLGNCLDMSNLGLRMFGCHAAGTQYAKFQSWKQHWDGNRGGFRLQAMGYGGGCLADYIGVGIRMAGCTTPGHAGYEHQLWFRVY